uniref:DUF4283 domain-containing protein n=1 Tax=Cannabis sativa TaxID=3483 RepID=A0A803PYN0_CANSA
MAQYQEILETEFIRSGSNRSQSCAEEVEDELKLGSDNQQIPRSAKQIWETFTKEKTVNRDQRLLFTEPLIRDGIKIAQVDMEEVQEEEKYWNSIVICKILGANPPVTIFERFVKRIWGHLGVTQVSKLSMGLIMVRFNDEATRDQVVEARVVQFDRKPMIVRPWSANLNAMNLVRTVPLWIRLHDLGLQYWGTKSLNALVSTIGKPIMVDQHTKDRTRLQYARVLVEMEITDAPPRFIPYFNEFGQLQDKNVENEWLPVKCAQCSKFGHTKANCRHDEIANRRKKNSNTSKRQTNSHRRRNQRQSPIVENKILVVWRKNFARVIVVREDPQFIHCYVKMAGQSEAMNVTFVYGFNTGEERKELWEGLINLKVYAKPWVITGDFNSLFDLEDRKGGEEVNLNDIRDSTNWFAQIHMDRLIKTGSGFTWTNNQEGEKRIYSKIDHTFVNEDWNDSFPLTKAHYSWETISDHYFCVVSMTPNVDTGIKPFRYYNFWADHPDFKSEVLDNWHKQIGREGMTGLYLKLMRLKHTIKRFNRERIGDVGRNYPEAKDLYIQARNQAQEHPHDITYQQTEKEAAMTFNTQEKIMENSIVSYTNDQGETVDNFREVVEHFIKHFQSYMGSSSRPSQDLRKDWMEMGSNLNREQQLNLIKPFTSKEIKKALFSIPDSKSPGPDCYAAGFFKKMWPEIGAEFTKAIENFFMTGIMPRELHGTMITLIPKTENSTRAVEFRPIACCSTIYKCISKLLCSRLSQVLPGIVNQNQGAFVQGISIANNVMILQDLLKNYKRKNISPRCTIKVHILDHDLLKIDILLYLVEWKSPREFPRQEGTETRYHPLCKNLKIVNLSFADDLMIFCKGDLGSIQVNWLSKKESTLSNLGVPLRPTKWKEKDCGVIINKIKQRLHTWASRHLSFAARAQLIHSVLLGLRNYWMSIFILPHSVTKEVEKLCRGFLWGWNGSRSKLHVASWEKVCLPKTYGGLGLEDGGGEGVRLAGEKTLADWFP